MNIEKHVSTFSKETKTCNKGDMYEGSQMFQGSTFSPPPPK